MIIGKVGILKALWQRKVMIGIIAALGFMAFQQFKIYKLEKTVLGQQLTIEHEVSEKEKFKAAFDDQNKKTKAAEEKSKEYQKQLEELGKDLDKQKIESDKIIQDLLDEEAPQTCEAIADYLLNGLEDLQWQD